MKYGRLTVVDGSKFTKQIGIKNKQWHTYIKVTCDCGKTLTVNFWDLKSGVTKSCGCLRIDKLVQRSKKHGLSNKSNPTYISWQCMKKRCLHDTNYKSVIICNSWMNSFENFLRDMGERPLSTTLDRIDNNKGYFKENCRWATRTQQNRNKPGLRYVTYKGQTKIISEWAEILGFNYRALKGRLDNGWSIETAFTKPIRISSRVYRHTLGG